MIKKFLLAAVIVLIIASVMPATSVYAAPVGDDPNPDRGKDVYPRLEKAFRRVQNWYEKQGEFLAKADDYISKAETFIGKAEQRGLDTSALRSLLESFEGSLPLVQVAHDRAGAIISAHKGFDSSGKVTDAQAAAQTVKDAALALQEGRQAHLGKAKALAEAIREFWRDNKPPRPFTTNDALLPPPNE
jgi:peptidoglycan hydrolase CwlO-like protein